MFHENENKQKVGVTILTSDKINFKPKAVTRDKGGPSNLSSEYLSEETPNTTLKRHVNLYVHCSVIYSSQDMEAT